VIENRPGAGGAISATAAAQAPPDGYTIYVPASSMFLTIPGKAPNLPLKLPRDFTAIGITVLQPQSIGINPKLGINSLPELIAQAKKEPDSISYAVTGVGRLTHLTGELLQIRANIKLQMVPYAGGSAQSLTDATAGRVSLVIEGYAGLAGSKPWRSPRRSVCLPFLMCRPLRKRCPVLSPSAGNAWWRRSEHQTRSCARSATICAQC
jgi:tripartite-type tricarboxylate transporter receptor subunit TctC